MKSVSSLAGTGSLEDPIKIKKCREIKLHELEKKTINPKIVSLIHQGRDKKYVDIMKNGKEVVKEIQVPKEQLDVELDDLEVVATLGVGGFGRVELVKCGKKPGVTYALKCLKKQHIVETQQQEHVFSEKNILMSCRHNFITR